MKVGRIIHNDELVNHEMVDYIEYVNKSTPLDFLKNMNQLPTLYVGWKWFKESNKFNKEISNVDILNKEIIEKKLYWEFSFDEKKSDHINGVEDFVESAPLLYFSNKYDYKHINPIFLNIRTVEDLKWNDIPLEFDVFYNYKNKMLYLLDLSINENVIYGVDLELFEFLGFNKSELMDYFIGISSRIIDDIDGKKAEEYLSYFNSGDELKKYLPVISHK
jgi:hypothetical protein